MIITKRISAIITRAALLLALPVCALSADAQDGSTAYQFLNVSPSTHVYALGGHNISIIDDDINLVEQNPALLGPEFNKQVGLNYMKYIGSTNFMGARYGQGIDDHSAFAAAIQYYGYGKMTMTDVEGNEMGTFDARDICFSATYSRDIVEGWRGGATLKYVSSHYESYSAGALAVDLGVNYYDPDHNFSASLVVKNLGGEVKKFGEKRNSLPWDIQVGISKGLGRSPVTASITLYNLRRWHLPYYTPGDKNTATSELVKKESFGSNLLRHLVFGIDIQPSNNLYLAIGYNYKVRTDMSTYKRSFLSGFSLGAGLKVRAFGFGVAFAQPHNGASTFMFNLTTSIGELLR
ncbi:MAG: type IX secretion system protein PorQ [Muribaculaceae bacterium]|nr:type IX secretion system protein PorQ [Muribaculaceae bacterium]